MPISPTLTAYPSGSGKSAAGGSTLLRRPPHLSSCLLQWQVCHITKAPVTAKFILHWESVWVERHVERGAKFKNGLKVVIYRWWVRFALVLLSGCQSPTWLVEDCNGKEQAPRTPEAAPRPAQVHAGLLILQLGGESRQDTATSLWGPGDIPHLFVKRPSRVSSFQVPGHPWPAGGGGRWDTTPLCCPCH